MNRERAVVAVRCDGNPELASGHLMRCLSIAEELVRRGAEPFFCFADRTSERWFPSDTYEREILNSDYRAPGSELPELERIFTERGADAVLIDHYHVDDTYLRELKRAMPALTVCVLDDFMAAGRPADLILNYTLPGRAVYAPLRRQFRENRMPVRSGVKKVFVSTGGSDPFDMRTEISSLVHGMLPDAEVFIPEHVEEMAACMASCDLAVSAGGTTVYELCAVGVPTILFTMADNQQMLAEGVQGSVENAGDVRDVDGKRQALKRIADFIGRMTMDTALRVSVSEQMRQVTDGRGAERIAEAILRAVAAAQAGDPEPQRGE